MNQNIVDTALKSMGWVVECQSPLEIRHPESGSFASGIAANIVIHYILTEYTNEQIEGMNG